MTPSNPLPNSAAAERNKEPILTVLRPLLPARGTVLEIASGTGQHVMHFAAALPTLTWQPSDPDATCCASIAARRQHAGLVNVAAPLTLDVRTTTWPALDDVVAMVCINMIHISPWAATLALMQRAAQTLQPGGLLFVYGPYQRHGAHTAPSNAEFDRSLRARNPDWGVRDLEAVVNVASQHGLQLAHEFAMPANNLSLAFIRNAG